MGSLYDIGNFRYKHFTFYSTCGVEDDRECNNFTDVDKEIKGFLNAVWPYKGMLIGDSSEGDYAFVTYVNQHDEQGDIVKKISNIYIYTRMSLNGGSEPTWVRAVTPENDAPIRTLDLNDTSNN
tara:strand:- start:366 stop:737 length:372 start_codon:yes stop_codon:yes gene_type:complete